MNLKLLQLFNTIAKKECNDYFSKWDILPIYVYDRKEVRISIWNYQYYTLGISDEFAMVIVSNELIMAWIRDNHKLHINIESPNIDIMHSPGWSSSIYLIGGTKLELLGSTFTSYDQALEAGLISCLNKIKNEDTIQNSKIS